ncbi:hypothetical protein BH11ACT6_BH11ACT6_33670 [soil metagenome]
MLKAAARDRIRTLCWAAVASPVALVATVYLRLTATWVAVTLLIVLIYLSYALRPWSARVASLALMGAITTYVIGAGHITPCDSPRGSERHTGARCLGSSGADI